MARNLHTPRAALLVCLGALLLVAACGDDDSPTCPPTDIAVVEGIVTSAGEGVAAQIVARYRGDDDAYRATVRTESDSTGHYRLEMPAGLYRIEIDDFGPVSYYSSWTDTVRVVPGVNRLDMPRGRLLVRLTVPEDYWDQRFRLECENDEGAHGALSLDVEDGILEAEFPLLATGSIRIRLSPRWDSDFYLPDAHRSQDAVPVAVGPDAPVLYELDLTESAGLISGRVEGSWVQGGQGTFSVQAFTLEDRPLAHVTCLEDGTFRMPVLLAQPFRLTTLNNGISQWIGGDGPETATVFDLRPGGAVTGIVHTESGLKVLMEGPGETIGYTGDVLVRSEDGREYTNHFWDSNMLGLGNLEPGRYYLYLEGICEDQVWAPAWYGGGQDLATAVPIDLGTAELKTLVMDLVEGGRLEGGVRPLPGLDDAVDDYRLFDPSGESICYGTDWPGGGMHYSGLPDGTYIVAARVGSGGNWFHPGTWDFDQAEPVVITDHARVRVEWDMPGIIPEGVR